MALSDVAVQQFADTFINVYQGMETLMGTTIEVFDVVGDAYKFKLAGQAQMIARGTFYDEVANTVLDYSDPTATFNNWILNTATDIFEQAEVNANERINLARVHAKANGRRIDQDKINALNASTTTNTIAAGGTNLIVEKLRQASNMMNINDVDYENRHLLIHANNLESLLSETETTSTDFNTQKTLVNGRLDTFMGFKIHTIGNRLEGGLPIDASNIRTCFAWHMDSVGTAFSIRPTVSVDWDPLRQSWLSISKVRLGVTEIDPRGIVKIDADES